MIVFYLLIFILLNFLIYVFIQHYNTVKLQIIFIVFFIIVIKSLCILYEKDATIFSLLQLAKSSITIPIFSLILKSIKSKEKIKREHKYVFFSFIWNEKLNFTLIFTTIIISFHVYMLLTGNFLTL